MELAKKILLLIFRMLPLRNDVILESYPDFSGNAYAVYEYLLEQGYSKKNKIFWVTRDKRENESDLPPNVKIIPLQSQSFKEEFFRLKALYQSRFILDSNIYIKKRRKNQVRFHLGHGMPIKNVPSYFDVDSIGSCDAYLTLGKYWEKIYVDRIGLPKTLLQPLGYPRNDVLMRSLRKNEGSESPYGRFVFWMPTYRQHQYNQYKTETIFPFGMPEIMNNEQLLQLNDVLYRLNMKIFFRPHPSQDLSLFQLTELSQVQIADDGFLKENKVSLYELLAQSEALMTDYSSVYFDYLLTGRPIGLTMGDYEDYFTHNLCFFDNFYSEIKGYNIDSFEKVLDFLEFVHFFSHNEASDSKQMQREIEDHQLLLQEMREKYIDTVDDKASERVICFLREKYSLDS